MILGPNQNKDFKMSNIEYYKSLISDEEVIKALLKDSKAREGKEVCKEKTRVRPNINFLQRTVTNLVSSNKRKDTKQEDNISRERKKPVRKIKPPQTLMREILFSNKIKCVESKESSVTNLKEILKNSIANKKAKIRKLKQTLNSLSGPATNNKSINLNFDKTRFSDHSCSVNKDLKKNEKRTRRSSDSSDISIVSISSSGSNHSNNDDIIIELSDDPGSSENGETKTNSKNVCKHRNKKESKKKRKKRKDT